MRRGGWIQRALLASALLGAPACGEQPTPAVERAAVLSDLVISRIEPSVLLPGTEIAVSGSFPAVVDDLALELSGDVAGEPMSLRLPLTRAPLGEELRAEWPSDAREGQATLLARAVGIDAVDGRPHASEAIAWQPAVRASLTPKLDAVEASVAFVNDVIPLSGEGFLLGGAEGVSVAVVRGCFTPRSSSTCAPIAEQRLVASPSAPRARDGLGFAFAPRIAGIEPGTFTGTVSVDNELKSGAVTTSSERGFSLELIEPRVFALSPAAVSLGGKVRVSGGGFVAPTASDPAPATTRLVVEGDFTPTGGPSVPVSFELVPDFASGNELVYALNEQDGLGLVADLRKTTGELRGNATPIVTYDGSSITGASAEVFLTLLPVKQVVYVRFLPSYVESLRHFGLRAVDASVRQRVLAVTRGIYAGINVDFRDSLPDDFALYTQIDVGGLDPNGLGLLGYDNTPGKDTGNLRLDDRVGGLNALTREGGEPGYGGVFVESLFGFSMHPGSLAAQLSAADPAFDLLFDPFRPDRGGRPALATESETTAVDAGACAPGAPRATQIACAARALGSIIGDTLAHELGHALGLADPDGPAFHNPTDAPGRLMDGGSARSFMERAALAGAPRATLCRQSYDYLRAILPTSDADPEPDRPGCD